VNSSTFEISVETDDTRIPFLVEGEVTSGAPVRLIDQDDDLTAGQPWEDRGYLVAPFLGSRVWAELRAGFNEFIRALVREATGSDPHDFEMSQYHRWINTDAAHQDVLAVARRHIPANMCFPADEFPGNLAAVIERISEICGLALQGAPAGAPAVFSVRIVRPRCFDHNPLHRDAWIDRLRNGINIYVPLAGSDNRSSLCVLSGSHHWLESDVCRTEPGARINGARYSVPAVVSTRHGLRACRPNPQENEVLVFSPYLIHGAGANLNDDRTRVSLEFRLWRSSPETVR
jgi:hypothetical protein